MEMAKVTSKGQITIPVSIRRRLKINEGDKILFIDRPDGVIMVNPDMLAEGRDVMDSELGIRNTGILREFTPEASPQSDTAVKSRSAENNAVSSATPQNKTKVITKMNATAPDEVTPTTAVSDEAAPDVSVADLPVTDTTTLNTDETGAGGSDIELQLATSPDADGIYTATMDPDEIYAEAQDSDKITAEPDTPDANETYISEPDTDEVHNAAPDADEVHKATPDADEVYISKPDTGEIHAAAPDYNEMKAAMDTNELDALAMPAKVPKKPTSRVQGFDINALLDEIRTIGSKI